MLHSFISEGTILCYSMAVTDASALSPSAPTNELYANGLHHLYEAIHLISLKNIYGGLLEFAGPFFPIITASCQESEMLNLGHG